MHQLVAAGEIGEPGTGRLLSGRSPRLQDRRSAAPGYPARISIPTRRPRSRPHPLTPSACARSGSPRSATARHGATSRGNHRDRDPRVRAERACELFRAWALPVSDHFWRIDGTKGSVKVSGLTLSGTPRACWSARARRIPLDRVKVDDVQVVPGDLPLSSADRRLLSELAPRSAPAVQPARAPRQSVDPQPYGRNCRSTESGGAMTDLVGVVTNR